jgi:hypothetical protein
MDIGTLLRIFDFALVRWDRGSDRIAGWIVHRLAIDRAEVDPGPQQGDGAVSACTATNRR